MTNININEGKQEQTFTSVTFDKYIYKKIVDLCVDCINLYCQQIPGRNGLQISWRYSRKFNAILHFCESCDSLPEYFKHPPFDDWDLLKNDTGNYHLESGEVNKFIMQLLNEIRRQEAGIKLTDKELTERLKNDVSDVL